MVPVTPTKGRGRSSSQYSTPATPDTAYVDAQESPRSDETPTPTRADASTSSLTPTTSAAFDIESGSNRDTDMDTLLPPRQSTSSEHDTTPMTFDLKHGYSSSGRNSQEVAVERTDSKGVASGSSSGSGSGSYDSELLEMLENDEEVTDAELDEDELDEALGEDSSGEPLVGRGRRRRRRKWDDEEVDKDRSLFELIPPLILAHPLPLLPLLALLPYNFLPAGVVFFIPIICVLTVLSSCAHIVIVYLSWYLKVSTFEEVFASVTGKYGRYGRWAGRAAVITSTAGLLIGWLETLHPLLSPVAEAYFPNNSFFRSKFLWTVVPALALLPSLLPSRMTRSLQRAPVVLALLVPVVTFLIIGRTVEIEKATREGTPPLQDEAFEAATALVKRKFGLGGGGSAGAGLTTLTIFLSPHLNTLPIHSTLSRNKRPSFPLPCLLSSGILLALALPFALVPYYLLPALPDPLPTATPTTPSGVFARLPVEDGWVNLARILQCAVGLGTCNMWILRGRDSVLGGLGVERGQRYKIGRWVGLGLWVFVVAIATPGGLFAEKIELLGVIATLAVGWLLPSVFFIITFHVRSPLSIVFPSRNPPADPQSIARGSSRSHSRHDSLSDPSADVLLARKERQLQKRRLGRRLWQDLIVYVGILPVGCITIAWGLGSLVGVW